MRTLRATFFFNVIRKVSLLVLLSTIFSLLHKIVVNEVQLCQWPPVNLRGREPLNRHELDIETLNIIYSFMSEGHYSPLNCIPNKKVALIVPYRDRETQLKIFLNNVIPRIYRQQQEFGIYVVEQTSGPIPFNKGMLANIGYLHAMEDMDYDCIIFHDVDILPEDDRNYYTCTDDVPIQMSTKVQKYGYKLPYKGNAGGIICFTPGQYRFVNGFSNQFFGWGCEDDDLYLRIIGKNLTLTREYEHGYCGSVSHEVSNKTNDRSTIKKAVPSFHDIDGLSDLNYTLIEKSRTHLFVKIVADFDMKEVRGRLKEYKSKLKETEKKKKKKEKKKKKKTPRKHR